MTSKHHRLTIFKVAGTLEQLLGGYELYHYHSKLMMKEVSTMSKIDKLTTYDFFTICF